MSAVMALMKFCLSAIIKGLYHVQRNTFHVCVGEILNGKLTPFWGEGRGRGRRKFRLLVILICNNDQFA